MPSELRPIQEKEVKLSQEEIDALLGAVRERREMLEAKPTSRPEKPEEPQARVQPPTSHVVPLAERVIAPANKSERVRVIEDVLASGLNDIYVTLDPQTQQTIRLEGEKTATQIGQLLESGKSVAKKVLHLIRAWLGRIPGVNRFFLEQESKIKTDKIIAMSRKDDNF